MPPSLLMRLQGKECANKGCGLHETITHLLCRLDQLADLQGAAEVFVQRIELAQQLQENATSSTRLSSNVRPMGASILSA